jgi:hypothetical protein
MRGEAMSDVSIEEVNTTLEITDNASLASSDIRKLLALVREQLRVEAERAAMRREDGDLRDRAWLSDVKPE